MRQGQTLLLSAVCVLQSVILADYQPVNTHKLRTLPVANIQAGAGLGPAGATRLPGRLVHGLLDRVRQLGVEGLRQVEDEDCRHQAERAEGEEGDEARHGGENDLAQQEDLRSQERTEPTKKCAAANPHCPDDCGENLTAVEEDDAEAGDDSSLADEGEGGDDGGDIGLVGGEEVFDENQGDTEDSAQHQIETERTSSPESAQDDEGKEVSSQLDTTAWKANDEINIESLFFS